MSAQRNHLHSYILTIKKSEREIKESIQFTIATKRMKYLGINLPKETKDLYTENYKTLMKEIKGIHKCMGLFLGFLSCSIGLYLLLCQCHSVLMTVALKYNLKSGRLIPPAPFFFFKTALAIRGLLCFHMNCEIFCSSSVKNAIGNLIGIPLNP